MKPRKMLPAPKWTHSGAAFVCARMAAMSNFGSATCAAFQASACVKMESSVNCIVVSPLA